MVNILALLFGD